MTDFQTHLNAHVLFVRFGQPDSRNLMTDAWIAELEAVLRGAADDAQVRCVHLSAQGKAFSSGGDLKDFLKATQSQQAPQDPETTDLGRFLKFLETFEKPLVAVVHGAAIGGGATMLLHCDFVYAHEDTQFRLPFAQLGIVPEMGSSLLLPLHAGQRLATELILLGRPFDAQTALRAGFVSEVLPGADLEARADETARALAAQPPAATRASKRLIKQAHAAAYAQAWREECKVLQKCFAGPEVKEAAKAFLEKRKPDFSAFS